MKKIIKYLFSFKFSKWSYITLGVALLWFFSPYLLSKIYPEKSIGRYFNTYAFENIDKEKLKILEQKTEWKLKKAGGDMTKKAKIIFINNPILFAIINPMNHDGLASNNVFFNIILVKDGSIDKNTANKTYPLDALLVHEVVHGIVKQNMNRSMRDIPYWISEGYAEHIAFYGTKNIDSLLAFDDKDYVDFLKKYRKEVNLDNVKDLDKYLDKSK